MNTTVLNLADRLDCEQARKELSQRQVVMPTNDFVTSEDLAASQAESLPILTEQQDFMTNTEIHDFCNMAELEFIEKNWFTKMTLASRQSAIIETILNDFSLSPAYQCAEHIDNAANSEPNFRFRHQVIRTYSRQPKSDDNVLEEADCLSDCSSSLSVQEDNTVETPTGHVDVFDANTSQCLCLNLKSLTEYYTQNSLQAEANPSDEVEDNKDFLLSNTSEMHSKQPAITKEIKLENTSVLIDMPLDSSDTTLTTEYFTLGETYDSCNSPSTKWSYDDFHWHDDEDYQWKIDHWLKINDEECWSDMSELEIELNSSDKKDGILQDLTSEEEMFNDEHILAIFKSDSSTSTSGTEAMIRDRSLTHFPENAIPTTLNIQPILSNTTNSKVISKSDSIKEYINTSQNVDLKEISFATARSSKPKSKSTVDFQTAANKVIQVSTETVKSVDKLLENLPEITGDGVHEVPVCDLQTMVSKDEDAYKLNEVLNKEALNPSRQETTNKIEDLFGDMDDIVNMLGNEWAPDDLNSNIPCSQLTQTHSIGFRTASSKSIQVSEKAKQRAANILVDLPDIPIKEKYNKQTTCNKQELNISAGKVEAVELAQDVEKVFTKSHIESLKKLSRPVISNIVSLKENLSSCENTGNTSTPGSSSGKRKLDHCDYTETTPLCPTSQHRKLQRLSDSNAPKTTAEHEQMKLSLSQLSQRSPLTECATSSIISRKNLLSLSKRRSQKQRPVQRSLNNLSLPAAASSVGEVATPNRGKPIKKSNNEVRTPATQNARETFLKDLASAASTPLPTVVTAVEKFKSQTFTSNGAIGGNSPQFGSHCDIPEISPICGSKRSQSCRGPGLRRSHSILEKKGN